MLDVPLFPVCPGLGAPIPTFFCRLTLAGKGGTGGTSSPISPGLPGTAIGGTRSPLSAFALLMGSSPAELDDEGGRRAERGRPVNELLRGVWGRERGGGGVVGVLGGVRSVEAGILARGIVLIAAGATLRVGSFDGFFVPELTLDTGFDAAGGKGLEDSPSLVDSKSPAVAMLSLPVDILPR